MDLPEFFPLGPRVSLHGVPVELGPVDVALVDGVAVADGAGQLHAVPGVEHVVAARVDRYLSSGEG